MLLAGDGAAFNAHHLNADTVFESDSSDEVGDTSVEALSQLGVPGVNDYAYFSHAAADSDTGVLLAESLLDHGPDATTTAFGTIAGIEQWLDVEDAGQPVTVHFRLDLGLSADSDGGAASAKAAGRLDVGSLCGLYVAVYAVGDAEVIDDCIPKQYPFVSFTTSAGVGALQISATYPSGSLPSAIDFLAQVENQTQVFALTALAQAHASGTLRVTVEGAGSYAFTSPTFLTVPEPRGALLGAGAILALAASSRIARG